jgi:hypothetical protein
MEDLKPCPFCGGEDIKIVNDWEKAGKPDVWHNGPNKYWVQCCNCDLDANFYFGKNERTATIAWNKRADGRLELVKKVIWNLEFLKGMPPDGVSTFEDGMELAIMNFKAVFPELELPEPPTE